MAILREREQGTWSVRSDEAVLDRMNRMNKID
jgi:hypothetical protein